MGGGHKLPELPALIEWKEEERKGLMEGEREGGRAYKFQATS